MALFSAKCLYCGKSGNYEISDDDWELLMGYDGTIVKCKCKFCLNLFMLPTKCVIDGVITHRKALDG